MKVSADRRGFTLTELIVAAVIGMALMGAIYQVLVTNQRVSVIQREQVLSQQTVRAGLDLLAQELREVSASEGDLLTMEANRVVFRAQRAYGLTCAITYSVPPVLTVATQGRTFAAGDQVFVFADGDPSIATDDQWYSVGVQSVTNGATCGTEALPAQQLTLTGPATLVAVNRLRRGAMVRAWEQVAYQIANIGGESYLVRVQGLNSARLVGPLAGSAGVRFEYLNSAGVATNVPASVARIRITLRTTSGATRDSGGYVGDSLSTSVFLRN